MNPYYEKENITIYHGDNCDVLGEMPKESVDLVVTSPPYDDLRTYGGHSWDFYGVAWQLKRVLKPGGVIVWVVADATKDGSETGSSFQQALHFKLLGLRLHDTMIYQRKTKPLTHNRYEQEFEYVFVLSSGRPSTWNGLHRPSINGGARTRSVYHRDGDSIDVRSNGQIQPDTTLRGNIWHYAVGGAMGDSVAFQHPATFPEALARDHILSWSNEGDVVLDPFSGSGTTVKMARDLGRRGIGIEVNQEYCDIAVKRLAQGVLFAGVST